MKQIVTISFLIFSINLLSAQVLPGALKDAPEFEFPCPPAAVFCFTGDDSFDIAPADDYFGLDFELVTKFEAIEAFSQIRFWGILLPHTRVLKGESPSTGLDGHPPLDFRINFYEVEAGGPGRLLESYFFEATQPSEILASEEHDGNTAYLSRYDLSLPEEIAINSEGFVSITRVNNHMPERKEVHELPGIFFSIGAFDEDYETGGETFVRGLQVYKSDETGLPGEFFSQNKDIDQWEAVPFKPIFALYNPSPIPLSNLALYFGMMLMTGVTVLFIRRKKA